MPYSPRHLPNLPDYEAKILDPLNDVWVIFADPKYNYASSLSSGSTEANARKFFVGKSLNMGSIDRDNMQTCVDIIFTNNQYSDL